MMNKSSVEISVTAYCSVRLLVDGVLRHSFDKDSTAVSLSLPAGVHTIRLEQTHLFYKKHWWKQLLHPFFFFGYAFGKELLGLKNKLLNPDAAVTEATLNLAEGKSIVLSFELVRQGDYSCGYYAFKCQKAFGTDSSVFSSAVPSRQYVKRYHALRLLPIAFMLCVFWSVFLIVDGKMLTIPLLYTAFAVLRTLILLWRIKRELYE